MKAGIVLALLFLGLTFTSTAIAATSITISGTPSTLDFQTEFTGNVSLNCSGCSDSYLRGVFYPSGTSYFGFTQDNNGSYNNSPAASCTSYFKIAQSDLLSGTWSGTLKFKPDKDNPYYNGPGEYLFKVGRYTSSCGSPTWSTEATIAITGPTPTPTPTPTTSSQSQSSPTPASPIGSSTKPSASPLLIVSKSSTLSANAKLPKLLPLSPSPTPQSRKEVLGTSKNDMFAYAIIVGIGLLLLAVTIFFREKIRSLLPF